MAVAFDSVGPTGGGGSGGASPRSYTHTTVAASTIVVVGASIDGVAVGATVTCTIGGVSAISLGQVASNGGTTGIAQMWYLTGVASGAHTIVVTCSTAADIECGSVAYTGGATVGTAFTNSGSGTTASVNATATATGNMVSGVVACGDVVNSTTQTSRWVNNFEAGAGQATGNAAGADAAAGGTVVMSWGINVAPWAAMAVEVQAPLAPQSPPGPLPKPPGWFPGASAVTVDPGGIPFYAEPTPTDATPASTVGTPFPAALGYQAPLVPPGWFPGADQVTTEPDGIPFLKQPAPADPSLAILPPPAPDNIGIPEWLPLPPGFFPGSQTVTIDPGGIPFYAQPLPLNPPPAPPPLPFINSLAGSGYQQYFIDTLGTPRLVLLEQAWLLPSNAGRWNGGQWQKDMDAYFQARAKQGYNVWVGIPWNNLHIDSTALSGGRTWDGIYPLLINGTPGAIVTGAETVTLNDPFWQRIDYLFHTARGQGMACFLNISQSYDISSVGGVFQHASNTQGTAIGNALATRYPLSAYPNVQWFFGDDDDGPNDSFYQAILTGMQNAGDARPLISDEQFTNTNCHIEFDNGTAFGGSFGVPNATYNWVYSYDAVYFGVEDSYIEGGTFPKIPPVYGDGIYYGDINGGTEPANRVIRNFTWWALASGARGIPCTSGPSDIGGTAVWLWTSVAVTSLTTDPNGTFTTSTVGAIRSYIESLTDWYKLIPDTGSKFITAGRGTRGTCDVPGGVFNTRPGNTYVAGSITPNGTLAIVYCKSAMSITIDQTKLGTGYTATWVDPLSLATQSAGTGSTYNSTPLGNNSGGDPDWVLVFQGPSTGIPAAQGLPVYQPVPPGWFPGADSVTTQPDGIPFYVQPEGDASYPAVAQTFQGAATLNGTGSLTAGVTQVEDTSATVMGGTGSLTNAVTESVGIILGGAGSLGDTDVQGSGATLNGTGSLTNAATQGAGATLSGTGSLTSAVTESVGQILGGVGSLGDTAVEGSGATLSGTGSLTATGTVITPGIPVVPQDFTLMVPGWFPGSDAVTANPGGIPFWLAPQGDATAVTTPVTFQGAATLSGTGSLGTAATQGAGQTLSGTGSLTSAVTESPGQILGGVGSLGDTAVQGSGATLSGTGSLTALVTQGAGATLSGTGSLTATGVPLRFGAATLSGTGSLTSLVNEVPGGPLTAQGSIAAPPTGLAGASLAALGSLTAAATVGSPVIFGHVIGAVLPVASAAAGQVALPSASAGTLGVAQATGG